MFVNFNILNQLGSPAINSNTFANRPAAGQTGRLFVSTDTFEIYRDNGTTWDLIGGPGSSTITGTGTATQVAYFTSSQAIGSSANLFWDNTSGFLGVATATPSARIEAVKTDGVGIYANFTTNAGSGSSTTALWAKNVTNSSGFAAVIEETTPNATAGQYPLLIKHSLSSGTAGVGMGTGLHFQLPDDAGTFKTTQLTIETINAAAATYATRYRFNVQSNGSSTPVAYINATGLGIFTATPGAALDVHSTGTIAQFNTTSATGNTYIAFQRTGTGLWRIGDTYNGGNNFFELHNTVLGVDAMEFEAATNKSAFQAQQTYTTGLARGNYFDFNLSVAAGGSFSSPNAITALTATLDLTLAGNATIPSGARSGLDAYNSIAFTGTGTLTHNQGTQIRAYSNLTAGWAFNGTAIGTITHLAGLRALFPDNSGSAVNVTNNYALLLNDQTANTGTVTYTNRWGVYQEGASDLNYMAANLLLGSTTNNGNKLQVTGVANITGNLGVGVASPQTRLHAAEDSQFGAILRLENTRTALFSGDNVGIIQFFGNDASGGASGVRASIQSDVKDTAGTTDLSFYTSASNSPQSEKMRILGSTGFIGIGTNTPTNLLQVQKNQNAETGIYVTNTTSGTQSAAAFLATSSSGSVGLGKYSAGTNTYRVISPTNGYLYNDTSDLVIFNDVPTGVIKFASGAVSTAQMTLNASGNLGLGVTPSTVSQGTLLDLGAQGNSLWNVDNNNITFTQNAVYNLAWKYVRTQAASFYDQNQGSHRFFVATSGTAGATIPWNAAARIESNGNFLIGTTTDSGEKLVVNGNIKSNSSIYTESGTITINSGVTSTIFTFGNAFGNTQVYMLTAMQSSGNTSWRLSAIVIGGDLAASGAYNVLTIGNNNISASFSGAALQITNSGGNATIVWRLLRLI